MSCDSLPSLPVELVLRIAEYLDYVDLLPLTAVKSSFRECLLPMVFRTIRVSNDEESANFALSMAKKYGRHINELHFEGFASPADDIVTILDQQSRSGSSRTSTLPEATKQLLGGHYLPNVSHARIQFMFDFDSEDWVTQEAGALPGFYDFDAVEWESQTAESESRWHWRSLMLETWLTLAKNDSIRSLNVVDLVPRPVSAFRRAEFHRFLGRLKAVEMSVWGADKGAGWLSRTLPGYLLFTSQLHDFFFSSLVDVTKLTLRASPTGMCGLQGQLHGTLGLRPRDIPKLRRLHLQNVFVGHELVRFLSARCRTLESLTLDHCMCSPEESVHGSYAKDSVSWATAFRALRESDTRLSQLQIRPRYAPFTQEIYPDDTHNRGTHDEYNMAKHIERCLQRDATLRIFGYGDVYESESTPRHDSQLNVKAFLRGEDMDEYRKLMAVVEHNAAR
ncbi:hypothetical protein AC579_5432 [Pseudocercospora musae]|uniref:F-box domain-containing protein n=1 Tax=Pseudocercospora musae TaxID=113226 RepID=A0A139HNI6_9PEZI|nr:hypothetical protein AC579_5432 [Pseudocercospora musae]